MALSTEVYGYLVDPLLAFVDDAGMVIKNGYIVACLAGTSTVVYTHSDWSGSVNPKHIPLDQSGRMANPAIVSRDHRYKVVICDDEHGFENPIKEVDNIDVFGSSVTYSGEITRGLNDSVNYSDFIEVTIRDNVIRFEDKVELESLSTVASLTAESSSRSSADTALGARIDSEQTARANADTALGGRIDSETSARQSADTALEERVETLETAVDAAATQAQVANAIGAERTARSTADNTLTAAINAEVEARESADSNLTAAVESLNTNLSDEVTARRDAVQNVSEAVQSEATSRANADSGLDSRITAIAAKIPAEASANNQLADKAFIAATYPTFTTAQREALNSGADVNKINQIETNRVTIAANNAQVGRDLATKASAADLESLAGVVAQKVSEAPNDGKQYVRKNQDWSEIVVTVDQNYNPNSANAQSGVAVAQVVGNIETLLAAL